MSELTDLQYKLDHSAADIAHANLSLGHLCVIIRTKENGDLACIAPDVDPGTIAEILYRAADTYASHAVNRIPADQISRLKN